MKLLFVGNTAWSMWNFRREVMQELRAKGHEIIVLAPEDKAAELLREHFRYVPLKKLDRKGKNPIKDLCLFLELYHNYRELQPDFIFQYTIKINLYGSVAAFFSSRKAFSIITGLGYVFTNSKVLASFVSIFFRLAASFCVKVIFLNSEDKEDFERFNILPINSPKADVLPGEGVDIEFFKRTLCDEVPSSVHTFAFIGRLLIDKGIRDYCRAASKVKEIYPNVMFQVIGPFDTGNPMAISREEMQTFVDDGTIEYIGAISDVRPYISRIDALVVPTYYGEGLSRVCLESLAMNVPVIARENRGCKDLVIDGVTGLVVPNSQPEKLAEAILKFLSLSTEVRRSMGSRGRELVAAKYSTKHVISFYSGLIEG